MKPKPGDLIFLKENPQYSGVVISRDLMKYCYKDTMCSEPYYELKVLWNVDHIPVGEVGTLGIGTGNIRTIIEDLVEVQSSTRGC